MLWTFHSHLYLYYSLSAAYDGFVHGSVDLVGCCLFRIRGEQRRCLSEWTPSRRWRRASLCWLSFCRTMTARLLLRTTLTWYRWSETGILWLQLFFFFFLTLCCGFDPSTWNLSDFLSPRRQDLYQRCEKMRPTLFRLASDTEDNDEALGKQHILVFFPSANKYFENLITPSGLYQLSVWIFVIYWYFC